MIIAAYLALLVAVSLPGVQKRLALEVSGAVSNLIGSKAEIAKVRIELFNSARMDSVVIYDQQGKKMLDVKRLHGSLGMWDLLKGKISVYNLKILNGQIALYREHKDSDINCQFLLDSIAPKKDGGKGIDVRFHSLLLRDVAIRYDVKDQPRTDGIVDPSHLDISKFNASVVMGGRGNAKGTIRVRNLELRMRNGMAIEQLQALMYGGGDAAKGEIDIKGYKDVFIRRLKISANADVSAEISKSHIRAYLSRIASEPMKSIKDMVLNGRMLVRGSSYNAEMKLSCDEQRGSMPLSVSLSLKNGSRVMADIMAHGAYDFLDRSITRLKLDLNRADVEPVINAMKINWPNGAIWKSITALKQSGELEIHGEKMLFRGQTATNFCEMSENVAARGRTVLYDCAIKRFETPDSIHGGHYGVFDATMTGSIALADHTIKEALRMAPSKWLPSLKGDAKINAARVDCCNISVENINANANYFDRNLAFELGVNDAKAKIAFKGTAERMDANGRITATANISELRPHLLGEVSDILPDHISGDVEVDISDSFSSTHHYTIRMNNLCVSDVAGEIVRLGEVDLSYDNDAGRSNYKLDSKAISGHIITDLGIGQLVGEMRHRLCRHLPSLQDKEYTPHGTKGSYCDINFDINDSWLVSHLAGHDVVIDKPISITAHIYDAYSGANITLSAPQFEVDGSRYEAASLFLTDKQDSLSGALMLTKYFDDTPVKLENHLVGKHDQLVLETLWKNLNDGRTRGNFKTQTRLGILHDGQISVHTDILPAQLYIMDTLWSISRASLEHDNISTRVKDLVVSRGDQFISINGDLRSGTAASDVAIQLNDIEIAYFLDLVGFDPVEFSGRASGIVRSAEELGRGNLMGDLWVRNFCFNTGYMGVLQAKTLWDAKDGRLTFNARTQATQSDSTLIDSDIGIKDNTLDITIRSVNTNMQFLNKYVGQFISDLEGATSGKMRLYGTFKDVQMEADEQINYLQFRPNILGVLYTFENQRLSIRPDTIDLTGFTARDPYGNPIDIRGSINHRCLRGFNYNFDFDLQNVLTINWKEMPERSFWGTFFSDGRINLFGTTSEVNLNGELTTADIDGASQIFYNSETSSSEEEEKDYIHFITAKEKFMAPESRTPDVEALARNIGADVRMNLKLNATPAATLNIITDPKTRDNMSLHGSGPLRIEYYNKGDFDLNGLYTIRDGSYKLTIKDIIRKSFNIQPGGYLRFNGNLADGDINLKGVHKINSVSLSDLNVGASQSNSTVGVDCILNFTGKTSNPNVSFDIDFPQANSNESTMLKKFILTEEDKNLQAVYLLSIGRFYTYNYDTFSSGTTSQSQSANAMTSFLAGTLSGQINGILQDAFHIQNWNFGTNIATGRQGFNDMEVQGTLSGKMFNNRMLFNGNFGYRDQMTTYSNNFVGDFNLQWLLNKAGTISLKAYSETNDRYFTKSSLTTQGGGILFKKDFNRFRDLFHKK